MQIGHIYFISAAGVSVVVAHEDREVEEFERVELIKGVLFFVGRVECYGTSADAENKELNAVSTKPPAGDEYIIHVADNCEPIGSSTTFDPQLPSDYRPCESVERFFVYAECGVQCCP